MAKKAAEAILVLQAGDDEPEVYENVSDEDVRSHLATRDDAMALRADVMIRRLEAVGREVASDPEKVVDYFMVQSRRAEVDGFLSEQLQDEPAEDHRGRIEALDRISGIGTLLLYEHSNFGGSSKVLSVTMPDFRYMPRWGWPPWGSFNDRASSAKAFGVNVLFEHTWYRGRRLWLVGLPYAAFPDFGRFDFHDIASSYAGT